MEMQCSINFPQFEKESKNTWIGKTIETGESKDV